jgi:hypothetical protein
MLKRLYTIGIVGYVVMFLLAWVFYKERTIFTDIAFHLFSIIKNGDLAIQNYRFVAAATQIFPLAARKLLLPLDTAALLYSLGFIIYYFAIYLLCGSVLQQYGFALVVLLFNLLFASDTFFWIQSELPQGAVLLVLVLAYMASIAKKAREAGGKISPLGYSLAFLGLLTVGFAHPLLMFPTFFVMLFLGMTQNSDMDRKSIIAISVFYVAVILIKRIEFKTLYDTAAMDNSKQIPGRLVYFLKVYATKSFAAKCLNKFCFLAISFLGITYFYINKKSWRKLSLFLVFFIGYLLLVNLSYPSQDVQAFYIENMYLPFGIILGIPIVFDILPSVQPRYEKWALTILVLIIATGGLRIVFSGRKFTDRLNWERKYLAANGSKKLIIDEHKTPMDTLLMSWGTCYEFWLLSTIEQHKTASIMITDNTDQFHNRPEYRFHFWTNWSFDDYYHLPQQYFRFYDTTSTYSIVK